MHEQKFKDLLSSTCLSSSERSMLELQSRGPGSIPTRGGVIFCFFHFVTQIYTILQYQVQDEKLEYAIDAQLQKLGPLEIFLTIVNYRMWVCC